jgi:integrase
LAIRINKTFVNTIFGSTPEKPVFHWDSELKGFGLKVSPAGRITFVAQYRRRGHRQDRRVTIGTYPSVMPDQARKSATEIIARANLGHDAVEDRRAAVAAQQEQVTRNAVTVEAAVRQYLKHLATAQIGDRHRRETERYFHHDILPALGSKALVEVSQDDLQALVDDRSGKPATARNLAAVLSKFVVWAKTWARRQHDIDLQLDRLTRPAPPQPRERDLSMAEVAAIWHASEELGIRGAFVRWCLLTGCRRSEAAGATWEEIDLEACLWLLPSSRSKNREAHRIPLNGLALELLRSLPRRPGLIFPGRGGRPIGDFHGLVQAISETSEVRDWTLHDLRRTLVSRLADHGVDAIVADRLLNHRAAGSLTGVMKVYQRSQLWPQRVRAMELWDELVRQAVGKPDHTSQNGQRHEQQAH